MFTVDINSTKLAIGSCCLYALATFLSYRPTLKNTKSSLRERRRPRIAFRNTHGISGAVATILTCLAIATQLMLSKSILTTMTSVVAAIASVVTASSGMKIVDQAPKQTVVMERPIKVVPPHRDAFKRTAYSIYYLCTRICWNTVHMNNSLLDDTTSNVINWVYATMAISYAMKYFVPSPNDVDWSNGNTYVFVVPMALGLTADAMFQLPCLQCYDETCWNTDIINQLDLLIVLLSGLVVAFVFTLAFRGVLGIRNCYWGAALVVHGIVAYLIVKALPFVMQMFSLKIDS